MENVIEFQRRRRVEFRTSPPTRATITKIRDKFKANGIVQRVFGKVNVERNRNDIESIYADFSSIPEEVREATFS